MPTLPKIPKVITAPKVQSIFWDASIYGQIGRYETQLILPKGVNLVCIFLNVLRTVNAFVPSDDLSFNFGTFSNPVCFLNGSDKFGFIQLFDRDRTQLLTNIWRYPTGESDGTPIYLTIITTVPGNYFVDGLIKFDFYYNEGKI